MKDKKPLSVRTQQRLAQNICNAVNKMVAYQFRLHHAVLHDAVNMQTEANRLRFKVRQLADGTYVPEPLEAPRRKPKLDGGVDKRRGCKGGPAGRVLK